MQHAPTCRGPGGRPCGGIQGGDAHCAAGGLAVGDVPRSSVSNGGTTCRMPQHPNRRSAKRAVSPQRRYSKRNIRCLPRSPSPKRLRRKGVTPLDSGSSHVGFERASPCRQGSGSSYRRKHLPSLPVTRASVWTVVLTTEPRMPALAPPPAASTAALADAGMDSPACPRHDPRPGRHHPRKRSRPLATPRRLPHFAPARKASSGSS